MPSTHRQTREPRVLLCMGTRPEIIKMGPVYHALRRLGLCPRVLHTGQHDEMAWPLYDFFQMVPDHRLEVSRKRPTLGHLGGRLLDGIDGILARDDVDAVLVHGDTTSALMGATAAFYARIPVGHVEAGLRSHEDSDPFPEEMNRVLIGRMAEWHFAPTARAGENLLRELVDPNRIHIVGNTIVDATRFAVRRAESLYSGTDHDESTFVAPFIRRADEGRLVVLTMHRRENWGRPIEHVAAAVRELLEVRPDLHVMWPVHVNPVVRHSVVRAMGGLPASVQERLRLTEPLPYEQMLWVLRHAWLVITDSGGVQEEAAALHKPVLVARRHTERPELIESGGGALVGTDPAVIHRWVDRLLRDEVLHARMCAVENPYGDGTAGESIARILGRDLSLTMELPARRAA